MATKMEKPYKDSTVMWQDCSEDSVPEPALLIEFYSDSVSISQNGDTILINYESIPDLCRLLKSHPRP